MDWIGRSQQPEQSRFLRLRLAAALQLAPMEALRLQNERVHSTMQALQSPHPSLHQSLHPSLR